MNQHLHHTHSEQTHVFLEFVLQNAFARLIDVVFSIRKLKLDEVTMLIFVYKVIGNLIEAPLCLRKLCH